MAKTTLFGNIKLIVLVGYISLFVLAIFSAVMLYRELVGFSSKKNPFEERNELKLVSNALVYMYETECIRNAILTDNTDNDSLKLEYITKNKRILLFIDSLQNSTTDKYIHVRIDSVKYYLGEKEKNLYNIILLLDTIKQFPESKEITKTKISNIDKSNLNILFKKNLDAAADTSFLFSKKRSFLTRVRDVFVDSKDSTKIITKKGESKIDSTYILPAKLLTDTVIQYFSKINLKNTKKNALLISQLSIRQTNILYYDELLSFQINRILYEIDQKERQLMVDLNKEKEKALKRSLKLVFGIAFVSLFTLIIFIILSMFFINRIKEYKDKLEISKKYAEDLLRTRESLLLMISHDIKTPLSSIIGHVELLSKESMPLSEKVHLDNMRSSSEHILDLVNKLLDFHRLEQGVSEINLLSFSPFQLMEDIYLSFVPIVSKKGLKFVNSNNLDKTEVFESDPFVIKQIINNLITNAIKFTEKGSIHITSSINPEKNTLIISVKDSGIGIKEENKESIFEEFNRINNQNSSHKVEGFGLGLNITKKLVRLLGGAISVDSTYGAGSEFQIYIPVSSSQHSVDLVPETQSKQTVKISAKVLLIDDDIVLLNVYQKLLEQNGATVTSCIDSKKVYALLLQNQFDIIITDIQMPDINGFELVKRIRIAGISNYSQIPVIALSARTDIPEEKFIAAGFTTFITKPVIFKLLIETIIKHTSNKNIKIESIENLQSYESHNKGIHSLIDFVKDDQEAAHEILKVFMRDNIVKLSEIKKAYEVNDWATIKSVAHKFLPLMQMIHDEKIVEILIRLEHDVQDAGDVNKLITMVGNLNQDIYYFMKKNYPEKKE